MNEFGLDELEQEMIRAVLRRRPEIVEAKMFGSRAKGNAQPASDIDLALWGDIPPNTLNALIGELDELPLPYTFDIQVYNAVQHLPLREHIDRVGRTFYKKADGRTSVKP